MTKRLFVALLAGLSLAACEAEVGTDGNAADREAPVENRVSIRVPGVDISVAMPDDVRVDANVRSDSELLYPGAVLTGVNIDGTGEGVVEIRFTSADAPGVVGDWYRDPARTGFAIDNATQAGEGFVLNGHETDDSSRFKLRLDPAQDGGTEGLLSIRDAN